MALPRHFPARFALLPKFFVTIRPETRLGIFYFSLFFSWEPKLQPLETLLALNSDMMWAYYVSTNYPPRLAQLCSFE